MTQDEWEERRASYAMQRNTLFLIFHDYAYE